jgi:hypothetical protein
MIDWSIDVLEQTFYSWLSVNRNVGDAQEQGLSKSASTILDDIVDIAGDLNAGGRHEESSF